MSNMVLELGESVRLTDEQFVEEMAARVKALNLTKGDYIIGCPLCLATIPPSPSKPLEMAKVSQGVMPQAGARVQSR